MRRSPVKMPCVGFIHWRLVRLKEKGSLISPVGFDPRRRQEKCIASVSRPPSGKVLRQGSHRMEFSEQPHLTETRDHNYDETSVVVLSGVEAVRKCPAMYIGSTGPDGLHQLIRTCRADVHRRTF